MEDVTGTVDAVFFKEVLKDGAKLIASSEKYVGSFRHRQSPQRMI